ncbi:MAG: NADH-quinone oxidoreductase subunit H [Armatimonadetes bacterium]|nr:NADH-quinone oxidoreductase subunit H [Armatimonadota bacterium]
MIEAISNLDPLLQALIRALLFVVPTLLIVPGFIWWERRLLSWMQDRWGPNRVATFTFGKKFPMAGLRGKKLKLFGLLQPIADGIKLFTKEDFTPKAVDILIYFIAPAVALFPAFALGGTIPWGPTHDHAYMVLTPVADVSIGVLYVMAVSSLGVYGIVLGGYAGNNKYSLLGGLRSSAQLISYELAMGMALAAMVTATGSLRMTEMVKAQEGPLWGFIPQLQNWFILTPFGFIAAIIFGICMVAETNRAPFDLPEAENELIAGYHTEYSSMKFAVYFMGEYAAMFVFSLMFAAVFLGGYNLLPVNFHELSASVSHVAFLAWLSPILDFLGEMNPTLAPLWFIGKGFFGITIYIWIRATLPRLRYDQLMNLGWKVLLPVGLANFLIAALWTMVTSTRDVKTGWLAWLAAFAGCFILYHGLKRAFAKNLESKYGKRTIRLVDQKPGAVEG